MPSIFERRESRIRSYCRSFPTVFTTARGAELGNAEGRTWIDFLCGAGAVNYGHNPPELKGALISYLEEDGLVHGLDMHSEAKQTFLQVFERLILLPRKLDYRIQFTGPTGTNAVEAAFKLARKVTGRRQIVSFTHGYHGLTLGALAATGNRHYRQVAGGSMGDVTILPFDGWMPGLDSLAMLERYITDPSSGLDLPAAVVVETVQGEGGINVASTDWLRGLASLCRRYGILLIIDDIQAGCGRTGTFFSFERAGIVPDMVTLSKSIGGYGLPMALVLMRPDLDVWEPAEHTGTFRGNNLAFVAAAAALETFWSDDRLTTTIAERSRELSTSLDAIAARHPTKLTRRGIGMMQGLICADPKRAGAISRRAFADGLIIECAGAHDEVVKAMPPLTISAEDLARGCAILSGAVDTALAVAG